MATLLRLLCHADGARKVIGEKRAVAVLATMWMQHTNCVPLIGALVKWTPSYIDNIWRAMQCGAIATAMRIMESIIITTITEQDGDDDDSSVMSCLVRRRHLSMRGEGNIKNKLNRTLSSSEEHVIDMTTRFFAMCCN